MLYFRTGVEAITEYLTRQSTKWMIFIRRNRTDYAEVGRTCRDREKICQTEREDHGKTVEETGDTDDTVL